MSVLDALLDGDGHTLRMASARNLRELGGFDATGGRTCYGRFVRCGSTRGLTQADQSLMRELRVTRVLDLRGAAESPRLTCALARQEGVTWANVPLYDADVSSPVRMPRSGVDNYLVSSYLAMLGSSVAVRSVFEFFARARPGECVLFHCAAGMDRTGVVSMLLLGLAGVGRRQLLVDYLLSFGTAVEVDQALDARAAREARAASRDVGLEGFRQSSFTSRILSIRREAMEVVLDALTAEYGSVRGYLESCDVPPSSLEIVRTRLVGPGA